MIISHCERFYEVSILRVWFQIAKDITDIFCGIHFRVPAVDKQGYACNFLYFFLEWELVRIFIYVYKS